MARRLLFPGGVRTSLSSCIAAAVTATVVLMGCATDAAGTSDPNAGLLRDFLDGKFDGAGHTSAACRR